MMTFNKPGMTGKDLFFHLLADLFHVSGSFLGRWGVVGCYSFCETPGYFELGSFGFQRLLSTDDCVPAAGCL